MSDALSALQRHAAATPSRIAVTDASGSVDYRHYLRRIAGLAHALRDLPQNLGLLAPNGIDWSIADLACMAAGKRLVPLPTFFSTGQLQHIAAEAQIGAVLVAPGLLEAAAAAGLLALPLETVAEADALPQDGALAVGCERIVYTSGTTGRPKGAIHGLAQLDWSARALAARIAATPDDVHLSVLPLPLLLEQLCAIHVPALAGAQTVHSQAVAAAAAAGSLGPLASEMARVQPTTSVLVPQQLAGWCLQIAMTGTSVPAGLRFVAVGGAPVSTAMTTRARALGIPVSEGYGLSECCSVVAVAPAGEARPGRVGRPLEGATVEIRDGQVFVRSAGLMRGYLGQEPVAPGSCWATGDSGEIDADGTLRVLGRCDDVLVTGYGRNIHPAWVEARILADPTVARCVLLLRPQGLAIALGLGEAGRQRYGADPGPALAVAVAALIADLPAYARPRDVLLLEPAQMADPQLFTASGRPRRAALATALAHAAVAARLEAPDSDLVSA